MKERDERTESTDTTTVKIGLLTEEETIQAMGKALANYQARTEFLTGYSEACKDALLYLFLAFCCYMALSRLERLI